jgi:hypothetical protein
MYPIKKRSVKQVTAVAKITTVLKNKEKGYFKYIFNVIV